MYAGNFSTKVLECVVEDVPPLPFTTAGSQSFRLFSHDDGGGGLPLLSRFRFRKVFSVGSLFFGAL